MADRIVRVIMRGDITGLKAAMAGASESVAATEAEMSRATRTATVHGKALSALGAVAKGAGIAVGAGLAIAIKEAADFGEKMALVQTLSHATAAQMHELSHSAQTAGTQFGYTANQVADAQAEMIKAGVSLKDIMGGGLRGTLALAAAGQTDVATATTIAASAMTQFGLKGKDIPHVADLLAAGADKALGSVEDLGYGLEQAGTTAHQMGLSIEDTTGTLAAFAQAGLIGERGGTTLKQMLLQLAAPTKQAHDLMDKYHLSLYQANGQLKSMPEIAGNVQKAFEHLTPAQRNAALGVIFGSRAIQGANILMQEGQKGISGWISKVNDQGFAAQQASGKLNSLKGDLQKLKAAAENAFIGLGQGAQNPLRKFVQDATGEIEKLTKSGDLERWGRQAGVVLGQVITDAKPLAADLGGALKVVGGGVKSIVEEFNKLPDGVQHALVTGAVVAYGAHRLGVDSLAKSAIKGLSKGAVSTLAGGLVSRGTPVPVIVMNKGFGGLPGEGGSGVPGEGKAGGWLASAVKLAVPIAVAAAAGVAVVAATNKVDPSTKQTGLAGTPSGVAEGGSGFTLPAGALDFSDSNKPLANYTSSVGGMLTSTLGKVTAAEAVVANLHRGLLALPKAVQTQIKTPGLLASVASVKVLADQYHLTPRQVITTLRASGVVRTMNDVREAQRTFHLTPRQVVTLIRTTGVRPTLAEVEQLHRKYHLTPKAVTTLLKATGIDFSMSEALKLQHQYHLTPREIDTLLKAVDLASGTIGHVGGLLDGLNGKTAQTFIRVTTTHQDTKLNATNRATGGHITGPGTATSDSIPAYLSNGEYVVRAAAVAKYGVHTFDQMNAMRFAEGGYANQAYAQRTQVSRAMASNVTNHHGHMPSSVTVVIRDGSAFTSFVADVADGVYNARDNYSGTTGGRR